MEKMTSQEKWSVLSVVRSAVAKEPDFIREVVLAAANGQSEAIERINKRRADLERAWVTALLVMNADRITPGLKKLLAHSIIPVMEYYGLEGECQAVRDAHKKASEIVKSESSQ